MANITRRNPGSVEGGVQSFDPFRMMREMLHFDPFREMSPFWGAGEQGQGFIPTFEVKETKDSYVFKADLPGVKEEDLDISLTGNQLTISGKREAEQRDEGERYFAYERSYGTFTRSFTLPEGVSVDDVRADLKNGVLNVVLPKRPEAQPKKIALKGGNAGTEKKIKA